jgi:hypothetical protein
MPIRLLLDSEGNIVIQPVTGWAVTASDVNRVVFLALEYLDHPGQLQTGARGQLQGTLSPQQALEIAAALLQAAGKLLTPPQSRETLQ